MTCTSASSACGAPFPSCRAAATPLAETNTDGARDTATAWPALAPLGSGSP
jgi:hypothetical protein